MPRVQIKISGMSCDHCVKRVTQALLRLPGVKDVQVDLRSGTAIFEKPETLSAEEIKRAIEEAGYQVVQE